MAKSEKSALKKEVKKSTKKTVKKEVTKAPKESFFKGVKKEMALVKWPTGKEIAKNTIATIVFCIIICAFFLLLNLGLSLVKGWFLR